MPTPLRKRPIVGAARHDQTRDEDEDRRRSDTRAAVTPRPGSKGERTRNRILDTALELFAHSGSNAVSLRSIAAKAGISHSGLLRYFNDKEALVLAAIQRRDRLSIIAMKDTEDETFQGALPTNDAISLLLNATLENMQQPGTVAMFVKLSAEATDHKHPAHDYFVRRYSVLIDAIADSFTHLMSVTHEEALDDARRFVAFIDGIQIQWLLDPKSVDMASLALDYLRHLGLDVPPRRHESAGLDQNSRRADQ
jgi:AcrR family transcriptional regulator